MFPKVLRHSVDVVFTDVIGSGIEKERSLVEGNSSYWNDVVKSSRLIQESVRGVSRIFERGGGPISLGSLKKGHQILKGGGGGRMV